MNARTDTKALRVVLPRGEKSGLELLRAPFPAHQISKLPKPTKRQTEMVREDYKKGIRCKICGGWHHPDVIHLDYVGHAALTDRLLDADPNWNWEPIHTDEHGIPVFDGEGGMWIRLTVCGVTRMGYGFADGKRGGDAIKETIGDALRNAAMRFGAALDLWHKGDLHGLEAGEDGDEGARDEKAPVPSEVLFAVEGAETLESLQTVWTANNEWQAHPDFVKAKDERKAQLSKPAIDDEIPEFDGATA